MKNIIKKILVLFLVFVSSFLLFSCSCNKSKENKTPNNNKDDNILLEVFESLEIEIDTLEVEGIEISYIEDELEKLNPEKIKSVEITAVPINDEVISLVRAELIQNYGADVDVDKLLKDILITSAVFIIDVVVTAASIIAAPASGGSSTAVGVTIVTAITKVAKTVLDVSTKAAAIISTIGIALDAAIEGVKAYNEGGDILYILGHALNGVVDGLKWSMLFYPFSVGIDKVVSTIAQKRLLAKATQYIDNIANVLPDNIKEKTAKKIFANSIKNADEILDIVSKATKAGNITNDVYESIAKLTALSADNATDIGKVIFDMFSMDKIDLYKLLCSFNPYDNLAKVTKKLQEGFLDISGETFEILRKGLVKKTINSLDDSLINPFKNKILENLEEFQTLFGSILGDELKKNILAEYVQKLSKNIKNESAIDIAETLFKQLKKDGNLAEALNTISSNSVNRSKNVGLVIELFNNRGVYNILASSTSFNKMKTFSAQMKLLDNLNIYSGLNDEKIILLFQDIIDGKYKNIMDIFNKLGHENPTSTKMLSIDYSVFKNSLDVLSDISKHEELLKSIAQVDLKYNYNLSDDVIDSILSSKNYSDNLLELLSENCLYQESYILQYVEDFSNTANLKNVINKCFENAGFSDDIIKKIRRGTSVLDIFNENEYPIVIKLFNAIDNVNNSLGEQFYNNFINDFNDIVIKYFENVVNENHVVSSRIVSQLLADFGYDSIDIILRIVKENSEKLFDIQLCQEVIKIYDFARTIATNRSTKKMVDSSELSMFIENLFNGNIKSSDDILLFLNEKSAAIVSSNFTYGEVLINTIKNNNFLNSENLIKNIQVISIASKLNNIVDGYKMADVVADVINNKLSYDEIINKYSYKVYYNFVEHADLIISKMLITNDSELAELITKLFIDSFNKVINEGHTSITKEMFDLIVKGTPLNQIPGLTNVMIVDNYSYLFNYAKASNSEELLHQVIEARTNYFYSLRIVDNTLNQEYAGKTFTTILGKEVEFTSNGHVILDNYAIAAVTLELTGDSSNDIAKANKLFFGTTISPKGYTWHHLEDGRTLILVPTEIHENVKHTGGAYYLRNYYDILFK